MFFFFFNDTATTEIYTLSLHDALPIFVIKTNDPTHPLVQIAVTGGVAAPLELAPGKVRFDAVPVGDRKSTRLNSSHVSISYAVFCLKKKKTNKQKKYWPLAYIRLNTIL